MTISVASGKGGTGKTTVAANLAYSLHRVTLVDCDVEEPNAHIFIKPEIINELTVFAMTPGIGDSLCDLCGKCADFCRFNAIAVLEKGALIFPELCHHCGGCVIVCPHNAIIEEDTILGRIEEGLSDEINFIHGISEVGLAESTPIIQKEKDLMDGADICIIDAPAGTSCLMVEAIRDSDFCLLVSEPTPFGLNDLMLAVQVVRDFSIPFGVIINRADIGDAALKQYCEKEEIPVLLEIPYERSIAESYSNGILISEAMPEYMKTFQQLFGRIQERI